MPKTPRKNPTPRKLLRLSAGELELNKNADVKELTEFSDKDSFSTAVDEVSEPKLAAINSSHSEVDAYDSAAAVCDVESTARGVASPSSHRRSAEQITIAAPEDSIKSTDIKTYAKCKKGSRYSRRQPKKVSTRNTKLAKCLPTDKPSDSKVDLRATSVSAKCAAGRSVQRIGESDDSRQSETDVQTVNLPAAGNCNSIITTDSIGKEDMHQTTAVELPSGDVMMLASAACGSRDAIKNEEDGGQVVAGRLSSPEEPEGNYMPTPQKNQLRYLSEELFSLNQESAHITTHIHRRAGTTPRRDQVHASGNRRSLSTPRKFNILNSNSRSNTRSPRSTPRKINSGQKTPLKVKFPFSTTPSKSEKEAKKTPSSKKKSPCSSSVLKFPTPNKKQTKRKLYAESPEYGARKPAKVSRSVL